jgi:hypothetical protein
MNGLVHYAYREKRTKSSFYYLIGLLFLILINVFILYVLMDVRSLQSINGIKRLYGDAGACCLGWFDCSNGLHVNIIWDISKPTFSLTKN